MHTDNASAQDAQVKTTLPPFVTLSPMDLMGMQCMQFTAYAAFYAECYRRALAAVNAKALAHNSAFVISHRDSKQNNFAVSRNWLPL